MAKLSAAQEETSSHLCVGNVLVKICRYFVHTKDKENIIHSVRRKNHGSKVSSYHAGQ
ncbi:MAG: hypothetical protein Q8N84_03050 [bacterium]|nr:hypothetical protein [bacterium]